VSERKWQLSLAAENDVKIQHLVRLTGGLIKNGTYEGSVISDVTRRGMQYDSGTTQDILEGFAGGEFYAQLNDQQRHDVERATHLAEDASWKYGKRAYVDALWDFEGPVEVQPVEDIDTLVLGGAIGADLFGRSERLDRYALALEPDLLRRAVLVGGVALVVANGQAQEDGAAYLGQPKDGLVAQTYIGGSQHGDFWSSRRHRFTGDAQSPVGDVLPFAPELERAKSSAYHSSEALIMKAFLAYQVGFLGVDPHDTHESLRQRFATVKYSGGGNFADFGYEDGRMASHALGMLIESGVVEGDELASLTINPGNSDFRMVLTARREGVEFSTTSGNDSDLRRFTIPSQEIEDYVVTLFGSGFGRTSQRALMDVIDTLHGGSMLLRRYGGGAEAN